MKTIHINATNFLVAACAVLALGLATPAFAHHPMGGAVPATFWQGLLSGFGHPVIEWDHLLFLLGAGLAAALARVVPGRGALMLGVFAIAGVFGTACRVTGAVVPLAEAAIGISLLLVALWLWVRWPMGVTVAVLFAATAGFVHGYAYGEAVTGAETTPLVAYLAGLALVQALLMIAVYFPMRQLLSLTVVPQRLQLAAHAIAVMIGGAGLWLLGAGRLLA